MAVASMNTYTHMPISTQRYIIKTKSNLSKRKKAIGIYFVVFAVKCACGFGGDGFFF